MRTWLLLWALRLLALLPAVPASAPTTYTCYHGIKQREQLDGTGSLKRPSVGKITNNCLACSLSLHKDEAIAWCETNATLVSECTMHTGNITKLEMNEKLCCTADKCNQHIFRIRSNVLPHTVGKFGGVIMCVFLAVFLICTVQFLVAYYFFIPDAFGEELVTLKQLFSDMLVYKRSLWIFIAPLILSPLLVFNDPKWSCLFVIMLLSCYWVSEVIPLAITALMPIFLFPALHVLSAHVVSGKYMNNVQSLFIATLLMALAIEETKLHKRVALKILTIVGAKTHWLMMGFMIASTFVSLWISDSATAALMCPIAYALIEAIMIPRMKTDPKKLELQPHGAETMSNAETAAGLELNRLGKDDRGISKCIMLMVCHASLIGGTGTIVGTAPNLILRDQMDSLYPGTAHNINYMYWMKFSIPPMFLYMIASWFIVQIQYLGFKHIASIFRKSTDEEKEKIRQVEDAIHDQYNKLGPMRFGEKSCMFFFLLMTLTFVLSDPGWDFFKGWTNLYGKKMLTDSVSGIFVSVLMFLWPAEKPDFVFWRKPSERNRPSKPRQSLLTWGMVQRRFPWSVILLMGAGYGVSEAVKVSGLSQHLGCVMRTLLSGWNKQMMQAAIAVFVVIMTEFTTNAATASVCVPIALNMAEQMHVHPLFFAIPAAVGPSFAFMLPMATPSNAIVYETTVLSMLDMASSGVILNVFCVLINVLMMNTWTWWIYDMGTYPEYATRFNISSEC